MSVSLCTLADAMLLFVLLRSADSDVQRASNVARAFLLVERRVAYRAGKFAFSYSFSCGDAGKLSRESSPPTTSQKL